jgi:hypothetical protein
MMATNEKLLAAIEEAFQLGTITDEEFEAEYTAAGGTITEANIEDAPDENLAAMYHAAPKGKGMRLYLASLIVARGLTKKCGCEHCREVEADARRWNERVSDGQ